MLLMSMGYDIDTGSILSHHASGAPYVGWRAVSGADEHLQGPVLPCLDVFGKVLVLKVKDWENNNSIP